MGIEMFGSGKSSAKQGICRKRPVWEIMMKRKTFVIIAYLSLTVLFSAGGVLGAEELLKTEKNVFKTDEMIKVLFSGAPGSDSDWICIVPAGTPDNEAGDYKSMPPGLTKGFLVFDAPQPGKYEARAYYNYRSRGYAVSARYPFSVVAAEKTEPAAAAAAGSVPLRTEKNVYKYGQMVKVVFSGAPGSEGDWICIVPAGAPDTEAGDYKYVPKGSGSGSLAFSVPQTGKYEVRAYYNYSRKGYIVSARYPFSVVEQDDAGAAAAPPGTEGGVIAAPIPADTDAQKTVASIPAAQDQQKTADAVAEKKPEPEIVRQDIAPSGYTLEYMPVLASVTAGSFEAALALADKNYQLSQDKGAKQDKHLKLLERGKVALAARKYDQCIADLQEAEKRFLTIEGTVSITEGLGSLATDDTVAEYEPEMHEKLMIPPYLVLAYLGKGDFEGARVERNKTISRIHQYIEENPERAYLENPFARLLSAVVYEMDGKTDDAKIEYRKMNRDDEIARLEAKKEKSTDLIVFADVGTAPRKYEVKFEPTTVVAAGGSLTLGFVYAAYNATEAKITDCAVNINGKAVGKTGSIFDLEKTIFSQYERNKSAMMAKLVARMTGKAAAQVAAQMVAEQALKNVPFGGLFAKVAIGVASRQWIAAEKADLRSWITLPRQIQYLRINELQPGEHEITLEYNGKSQVHKVNLEEGKISVIYFCAAG